MNGARAEQPISDTQLFRDVCNASPIGIAVESLEGQPVFVNSALCSMLGFSEEEMCGKHCVDFSPPEDAEKDWELFQQLRAGSIDHYQLEKRYFRRDGSLFWGRLSLSLLNHRPSPLVIAMVEDITDQKKAEEARFALGAIVESSEDAIASGTLDGIIVSWNAGAEKMYGYTETEAIGKPITILVPPELPDEENKILETVKAGGRIEHFETVRMTKTGKRINVSLSICPIKDSNGAIVGLSGIARDVTERKRHEEARLRLAAIVESSEDAIISKDLDGVITSWNAGAQHIFGYTEQEAIGQSIILIPPELLDDERRVFERLKAGERIEHYESIRFTKTREEVNVSLSISPIRDSTGTLVGFSKIARDITDRKLAEKALAEMTRKLIEAQEQERTRIGRELHDDINQRLAMLAIELEELEHNSSGFHTRLQEIRKGLIEISHDVQALSHDLHSSKLQYLGVVGGIKGWCREFAERRRIEIDFRSDVPSHLPLEIGVPLFRVVQEALNNAVKHSGAKRIEVQLTADAREAHLTVSDLGKGFDPKTAMQGHGHGLISMRERVRLVNGTIAIDSKPMTGTSIHVHIPLKSEKNSQEQAG